MQTHATFTNIVLHSDVELAEILGTEIMSRETIHAWPLSCVQQLLLNDGKELIYKSQLPPTVEPLFYQRAASDLLPHFNYLGKHENCEIMILDKISAPLLSTKKQTASELFEHGKRIIEAIGKIGDKVPVYLDIGSANAWQANVQSLLEKFGKLISTGRFRLFDSDAVDHLRTWSMSDKVLALVKNNPRLTHGDLKADQVFITPNGYKVIDWQRPVIAPPETDLVALLVGQQVDPHLYLGITVISVFWFLRLHWAIEAQHDLFPEKRWPLFDEWAREAIGKILG